MQIQQRFLPLEVENKVFECPFYKLMHFSFKYCDPYIFKNQNKENFADGHQNAACEYPNEQKEPSNIYCSIDESKLSKNDKKTLENLKLELLKKVRNENNKSIYTIRLSIC